MNDKDKYRGQHSSAIDKALGRKDSDYNAKTPGTSGGFAGAVKTQAQTLKPSGGTREELLKRGAAGGFASKANSGKKSEE